MQEMKVKVKKIKEQLVEHFNPNKESVGFLTANENLYLRCRIKEFKECGWYLMFKGNKIEIDEFGSMDYPIGLYRTSLDLLNELFEI